MPRLFLIEQSALAEGGHYHAYTTTVAAAARRIGLDVTILTNKRFTGSWTVEGATVIPVFQHTWGEAEQLWVRNWEPGNIAYDFARSVRADPPRPGDHVLFATLGYAEMTALLEYFVQLPITHELPFFHILLRYDPQVLRDNVGSFRPMFDRIAASIQLRRSVLFHADTDLLSAEFSDLTGFDFTTLPIPFRQDYLVSALAIPRPATEPLVVTYLGDARLEKNFDIIPAAIDDLWKDYVATGRVRFVLQSNFNIEGGEPGMLRAVQKCGQYPPDTVELIHLPMDNETYSKRLAAADIVLIPYDADRYRVRSSGILIEAMAAGKPVVTTQRTWMETQVSSEHAVLFDDPAGLGTALKRLIDDYATYQAGAERIAPGILAWSSGENFVRTLLATAAPRSVERTPRILLVADGDTLVQRNGAGLTSLTQLRYLRDAGYLVSGLFLMNKRDWRVEEIEAWTEQLRDRLAEFDLEAAFLAGSGRLSFDTLRQRGHRVLHEHTIAGDLAQVRAFDVPLELVDYLRKNRPDAIWLNYVTNAPLLDLLGLDGVPVLCETHDIQSFQKAIYGGRRVDDRELGDELKLLGRYEHLISVSAAETAYLLRNKPDAKITTTGIFPPPSGTPIANLAGAKNLGEVVSSCLPELPVFDWDAARRDHNTGEILRLAGLPSVDLVYVSSSHVANVSGLRWFLDEVYVPLLAPFGVSMVVAGSIREATIWPECERLVFVGRLKHLAPLYSAARIVVLPILEGAGVAVKAAEALSFGRPIVATPFAMRGLEGEIGGVEVARTPFDFARVIRKLLASDTARAQQAKSARETACRLADPAHYAELLNGAFTDVLGARARPVRREPASPNASAYDVEWGDVLVDVNRIVRDWLEGELPEIDPLRRLGSHDPEQVRSMLRAVLDALLVSRSAHLLSSSRTVRDRALVLGRSDAAQALDLLTTAVALLRRGNVTADDAAGLDVIYETGFALDVWVFGNGPVRREAIATWTEAEGPILGLDPLNDGDVVHRRLPARDRTAPRLAIGRLRVDAAGAQSIISQPIVFGGIDRGGSVAVAVPELSDGPNGLMIVANSSRQLRIPVLQSPFAASYWLDLVFLDNSTADVLISVDGSAVLTHAIQHGDVRIIRVDLPSQFSQRHRLSVVVEITAASRAIVLTGAFTRLVFGINPGDALSRAADVDPENFLGSFSSQGDLQALAQQSEARAVRELVVALEDGFPLSRTSATVLSKRFLAENGTSSNFASLMDAYPDIPDVLLHAGPLLEPMSAIREGERHQELVVVASWRLPLELEATFSDPADAAGAISLVDGERAVLIAVNDPVQRWSLPALDKPPADRWRRTVTFEAPAGHKVQPRTVQLSCNIPIAALTKLGRSVELSNFHPPDNPGGEVQWTWSDSQPWATILLPLALLGEGTVRIRSINLGQNVMEDDLRLFLNGIELSFRVDRVGSEYEIVAGFEPYDIAVAELAIWVRHRWKVDGDPRTLGIGVRDIEFTTKLIQPGEPYQDVQRNSGLPAG